MMRHLVTAEILLVEDSPSDVLMTRESLNSAKILNDLRVVEDGVEAMAYLRRQGKYADQQRPHIVLLDLNLPRKTGHEVLAEMKGDAELKSIPVVVLTTSKAEEDVLRSYGHHANCYVTKPVDFKSFASVIWSIENFWFTLVTLPDELV